MRIMNNVSSLNAWRNLSQTDGNMSKSLERLSSGYRINRAADDVAGLAISENMRAQIKGLNQAVKNAQDGVSLLQTAEGSLNEVHSILQRMRELSLQAANGTLQPEDRTQIQTEMDNLAKEITRTTNATQFNSKDLIDGSLQDGNVQSVTLQIGPNGGQTVNFSIGAMDAKSLGIARDVTTGEIDNGLGRTQTVDATVSSGITGAAFTLGTGLSATKDYQILADSVTGYQLQSSTDGGKTWSNVGGAVAYAAGATTVGVGATNETVTFTAGATGPTVTNKVGARVYNNNSGFVAQSFGTMGAGLTAGNYTVNYDSNTQTVQLKDSTGANVGDAVNVSTKAGQTITLGDGNTARTMDITLKSFLPSQSMTDTVTIGSTSAHVTTDPGGANQILASGTGAAKNVGTGLTAGNYQVAFSGGNVQLQDMSGNAIGAAVAFTANATVTIGDAATQRTVDVKLAGAAPGAAGAAVITVTNNDQSAQAATFSGGVKRTSAQAFAGLNVSSADGAQAAIAVIDKAIGMVSYQRSQLGAIQNRLDHTVNNLQVVSENLTASESRIRDVDMAQEMSQFTKSQILMQSGTAMLAQANQKNQAVLQLLR